MLQHAVAHVASRALLAVVARALAFLAFHVTCRERANVHSNNGPTSRARFFRRVSCCSSCWRFLYLATLLRRCMFELSRCVNTNLAAHSVAVRHGLHGELLFSSAFSTAYVTHSVGHSARVSSTRGILKWTLPHMRARGLLFAREHLPPRVCRARVVTMRRRVPPHGARCCTRQHTYSFVPPFAATNNAAYLRIINASPTRLLLALSRSDKRLPLLASIQAWFYRAAI